MEVLLLFISLLALASGPVVWLLLRRAVDAPHRRRGFRFLDAAVLVSVTLLLVLEVMPGALARGGLLVLASFTAGLLLPEFLEFIFRRAARAMHLLALSLALLGIGLHALVDGAMLSGAHALADSHADESLALAIVLHRIPIALMIWWLLYPALGLRWAAPALVGVGAATLIGFFAGSGVPAVHALVETAWLQALTAGMILHAIFNRPHLHTHGAIHRHDDAHTGADSAHA